MGAHCLSVLDNCKEVCKPCQDSYDNYVRTTEDKLIRDAVRVLESRGYTIKCPVPDVHCITLPNGDCVGGLMAGKPRCMHD